MVYLKDFQEEAVQQLYTGLKNYMPFWREHGGHPLPDEKDCVLQLKLITGGGKTPIMASFLGNISDNPGAIVLWTTPLSFVAKQTFYNLIDKYNNLLPYANISEASNLTEDVKNDIIQSTDGLDIIIATTGIWNRSDKETLRFTKATEDGGESFWNRLTTERNRPLLIVYDEGHNASIAQIDRLKELNPSGYLIASASPLPDTLQPWPIQPIHIPAKKVVEHGLLKTTIEIGDYHHNWETRIEIVVNKQQKLATKLEIKELNLKLYM